MEEEIWKDIPGWDGLYQASTLGNIRSLDRKVWNHNGYVLRKGRILRPAINTSRGTPYMYVRLNNKSLCSPRSLSVSVLVCTTFNGKRPSSINGDNNVDCMHLNGNSLDNRPENLKWGTHTENMNEKTCRENHILSCSLSRPVIQFDLSGNEIARFPSVRAAARALGLWSTPISECARGVRYKQHGGYVWKYVNE